MPAHTLYLAGPMTGIPRFNFPLFDAVASELRDAGYTIISPAELDDGATREAALSSEDGAPGSGTANGETYGTFLSRDVKLILDEADGVCVLPGWYHSDGARIEVYTAFVKAKPVMPWNPQEGALDGPLSSYQLVALLDPTQRELRQRRLV